MKSLYASTGLALVLGLGVAGADLPARAADAIVLAQADGGQGGGDQAGAQAGDQDGSAGTGEQGGSAFGDQPGSGPGDPAGGPAGQETGVAGVGQGATGQDGGDDEYGAVHPLEPSPVRPDYALRCDVDGDSFVNMSEARACYEQQSGTISGGSSHATPD